MNLVEQLNYEWRRRQYKKSPRALNQADSLSFLCGYCRNHVVIHPAISGVNNRNHCPYCLYSRHLDLFHAGDRLSACKGWMRPTGLTLKRTKDKYNSVGKGELMIVHICLDCGKISLNRLAADDLAEKLYEVYKTGAEAAIKMKEELRDIQILGKAEHEIVKSRLFGKSSWN